MSYRASGSRLLFVQLDDHNLDVYQRQVQGQLCKDLFIALEQLDGKMLIRDRYKSMKTGRSVKLPLTDFASSYMTGEV